jgi:hypothetical protein
LGDSLDLATQSGDSVTVGSRDPASNFPIADSANGIARSGNPTITQQSVDR